MASGSLSRRSVLAGAGVAAGGLLTGPGRLCAAPSEKLGVGFIGGGGIANSHLGAMLGQADCRVLAVADPKKAARDSFAARINKHYGNTDAKTYVDFRELLARPDIDAVLICTPDNWHALQTIHAARAGKHIYSEKPFAKTVAEGRAMVETIQRQGVVFQHGTQQRSDRLFRQACELVRNGRIGQLEEVHVSAPGGRQGGNGTLVPVPDTIDYDLWLGPAPWHPYSNARVETGHWYYMQDYSQGGFISGWGIHHVDIAQWGLGTELTGPVEIEGTGVFPTDGLCDTPITWRVVYKFADGVPIRFTSHEDGPVGVTFKGSKGSVWVTRGAWRVEPEALGREPLGANDTRLYHSPEHHRNWIDCIKTGAETICPPEVGHRSQTICALSDIAIRLGRKLRWDAKTERCVDDETANRLLSRALREPWTL